MSTDKESKTKIGNKGNCKACGNWKTIADAKGYCDRCMRLEKVGDNPLKDCECGDPNCHEKIRTYSLRGKVMKYVLGHHIKGEKNPRYNGYRTPDKDGYIYVRAPNHPFADSRGYIREHRLVLEKKLGRYLTKDEVAHHINGLKDDNRPENIELMVKKQHDGLKDGKTSVDASDRVCIDCGITNEEYRGADNSKIWYENKDKEKTYLCRVCYERRQRARKRMEKRK